jgi:hypothetical protein
VCQLRPLIDKNQSGLDYNYSKTGVTSVTSVTDQELDIVEKTEQRVKDEKNWLDRKLRGKHETSE